jgi:hypothetical protein
VVAFVATTGLDRARVFYEQALGVPVAGHNDFACVLDANGVMLRSAAMRAPGSMAVTGYPGAASIDPALLPHPACRQLAQPQAVNPDRRGRYRDRSQPDVRPASFDREQIPPCCQESAVQGRDRRERRSRLLIVDGRGH